MSLLNCNILARQTQAVPCKRMILSESFFLGHFLLHRAHSLHPFRLRSAKTQCSVEKTKFGSSKLRTKALSKQEGPKICWNACFLYPFFEFVSAVCCKKRIQKTSILTKIRTFLFREGFSEWDGIMNQLNNSLWCNGADFRLYYV